MSLHAFVTSQIIVIGKDSKKDFITGISKTYFLVPKCACTLSNFFTQVQLLHAYEHFMSIDSYQA